MTIRHMQIFTEVFSTMKITQAAENLHMTQPAVSRAVQELERHYGTRLFERTNRRLSPTQAGRVLYGEAQQILEMFRRMEQSLSGRDAGGVLRVGGGVTFGSAVLPLLAERFRAQCPGTALRVTVTNAGQLQKMLCENTLDLALVEGSTSDPSLRSIPFIRHRFTVLVPPEHPLLAKKDVRLQDLTQCPLLLREPGSAGRSYLDSVFQAAGFEVLPLWESVSTQAILEAVSRGIGISVLPQALAAEALAAGRVASVSLCDTVLERPTSLALHKDKFLSPSLKAFLALCEALQKEEAFCTAL